MLNCAVIPLLPLPGTVFWDMAIKKGLISERGDHIKSDGHFVYMCEHMSQSEFSSYMEKFSVLVRDKVKKNITLGERLLLELREIEK